MKKTILFLLLVAIALMPALAPEAVAQENGNGWRLVMSKHNLRDAALSAGDSLHRSDLGFGKFLALNDAMIDSIALAIRSTDSLGRGRLIIERMGANGVIDTVGA